MHQPPGPGVLGSIPKREEPGKTGAPCVKVTVPGSSRVPVRDEQTNPHRPRLVVSHSTCPPLSSPPPRKQLCNRSCSNKTHLSGTVLERSTGAAVQLAQASRDGGCIWEKPHFLSDLGQRFCLRQFPQIRSLFFFSYHADASQMAKFSFPALEKEYFRCHHPPTPKLQALVCVMSSSSSFSSSSSVEIVNRTDENVVRQVAAVHAHASKETYSTS